MSEPVPFLPPYHNMGTSGGSVPLVRLDVALLGCAGPHFNVNYVLHDADLAEALQTYQRLLGFTGSDVDGNYGPGTRQRRADVYGFHPDSAPHSAFTGRTINTGFGADMGMAWPKNRDGTILPPTMKQGEWEGPAVSLLHYVICLLGCGHGIEFDREFGPHTTLAWERVQRRHLGLRGSSITGVWDDRSRCVFAARFGFDLGSLSSIFFRPATVWVDDSGSHGNWPPKE